MPAAVPVLDARVSRAPVSGVEMHEINGVQRTAQYGKTLRAGRFVIGIDMVNDAARVGGCAVGNARGVRHAGPAIGCFRAGKDGDRRGEPKLNFCTAVPDMQFRLRIGPQGRNLGTRGIRMHLKHCGGTVSGAQNHCAGFRVSLWRDSGEGRVARR